MAHTTTLCQQYKLLEFYPPNANFIVLYKDPALLSYIRAHFTPKTHSSARYDSINYRPTQNPTPNDKNIKPNNLATRENSPIILAQTDTTAGFLSQSPTALNLAKHRPINQLVLTTFASLQYATQTHRVPRIHRHFVRQASKVSIILPSKKSFRVVKDPSHRELLRYFGALYSTSANHTKKPFSLNFALQVADIIAIDSRGFYQAKPSAIYRLSRTRKRRLR